MEVRSSGFPEAGVEQDKGLLDLGGLGTSLSKVHYLIQIQLQRRLMTTKMKRALCSWSLKEQPFPPSLLSRI